MAASTCCTPLPISQTTLPLATAMKVSRASLQICEATVTVNALLLCDAAVADSSGCGSPAQHAHHVYALWQPAVIRGYIAICPQFAVVPGKADELIVCSNNKCTGPWSPDEASCMMYRAPHVTFKF